MSEQILQELLKLSPQLGFIVLFLVALGMLLKEYRGLRTEIKSSVEDVVNSRLGATLGSLQIESVNASKILADIGKKYEEAQSFSTDFEQRLEARETTINETLERLEEKLQILGQAVPSEDQMKYSAQHFAVLARNARSLGEAVHLIEEARKDVDATSQDLEVVGDVARRFRRWTLARSLYTEAVSRDPSNSSAKIEVLALAAETDPAKREEAFAAARAIVLDTLEHTLLGRLANAYYYLHRYADVQSICEEVLERTPAPDSKMALQAHRDLAVALKQQDRLNESAEHCQSALAHHPDDENLLKAYVALLRDKKDFGAAIPVAQRLLTLDPLDGQYHYMLGQVYSENNRHGDAAEWFSKAAELMPEGGERELALREKKKSEIRKELRFNAGSEETGAEHILHSP